MGRKDDLPIGDRQGARAQLLRYERTRSRRRRGLAGRPGMKEQRKERPGRGSTRRGRSGRTQAAEGRRPVTGRRLVWREGPRTISLIIDPTRRAWRACYDSEVDRIAGFRATLDKMGRLDFGDVQRNIQSSWKEVGRALFGRDCLDHWPVRYDERWLSLPFRADKRRPVSRVYLLSPDEPDVDVVKRDTARSGERDADRRGTVKDTGGKNGGRSVEAPERFDDIIDSSSDSDAVIDDYLESQR
jgi:hypothetical protein